MVASSTYISAVSLTVECRMIFVVSPFLCCLEDSELCSDIFAEPNGIQILQDQRSLVFLLIWQTF